jgi:hypothetical protein
MADTDRIAGLQDCPVEARRWRVWFSQDLFGLDRDSGVMLLGDHREAFAGARG